MGQSLYDKYGGFGTINKIVIAFYDELLESDELGPYFDDVDMRRLIDHQTKFVAALLGGPAAFTDDHIHRAHAGLGVTHAHYDELKRVLAQTLTDHGVVPEDVDTVMAAVEARRDHVVA